MTLGVASKGPLTILDTTLRDGALNEDVSLGLRDKLRLAPLIDSLGVHLIEGGWPQVFPDDLEFFREAAELGLRARLVAFGATRRPETRPDRDAGLRALLAAGTPVVQLYGKVWPLHVEKVLRTTLDENLAMLRDSVALLKSAGREVMVIAEHLFDARRSSPDYADRFLEAALEAGADLLTLGDSNGGSLPEEVAAGVRRALELSGTVPVGVHLHNDFGLALANALAAVEAGATHVQGSVNGYGARNGITDLTALLPILKLRLGLDVVSDEQLARLTPVAHEVAELVGLGGMDDRPFVGHRVFAHKTETHVAAVLSDPEAYEPITPERVGNQRRIVIPGVSRPAYLARVAERYGVDLRVQSAANARILTELRRLEDEGYSFEDAPASLELAVGRLTGRFTAVLGIERVRLFEVIRGRDRPVVEAALRARVGDEDAYVAAEADGPVAVLLQVLRDALETSRDRVVAAYSSRLEVRSFRVRTMSGRGDDLRVRAAFTLGDGQREWSTVGISVDLIQAVWSALLDAVEYGVLTRPGGAPDA